MSSFTRRIQRMSPHTKLEADRKGGARVVKVRGRNREMTGPGSKLGVVNPNDACRTGKTKKPKVWCRKSLAPPKPKLVFLPSITPSRDELATAHRAKMARKAVLRGKLHQEASQRQRVANLLGTPAGINRHTGKPHKNLREIARRRGEG